MTSSRTWLRSSCAGVASTDVACVSTGVLCVLTGQHSSKLLADQQECTKGASTAPLQKEASLAALDGWTAALLLFC
jgi:hypothetical protein